MEKKQTINVDILYIYIICIIFTLGAFMLHTKYQTAHISNSINIITNTQILQWSSDTTKWGSGWNK